MAAVSTFTYNNPLRPTENLPFIHFQRILTPSKKGDAIPAGYVSCVELTVGFLVVSIPVYRKFYKQAFKGEVGGSTGWSYKSDNIPLRYNKSGPYNDKGSYGNASNGYKASVTNTSGGNGNDSHPGINITKDVDLVTHTKRNDAWVRVADEENMPRTMV